MWLGFLSARNLAIPGKIVHGNGGLRACGSRIGNGSDDAGGHGKTSTVGLLAIDGSHGFSFGVPRAPRAIEIVEACSFGAFIAAVGLVVSVAPEKAFACGRLPGRLIVLSYWGHPRLGAGQKTGIMCM